MNNKIIFTASGIYWWLRVVWLALRWIPQVNLGDLVYYKGREWSVCNGVYPNSWRLQDGQEIPEDSKQQGDSSGWVPRSECKKVWTVSNVTHSFWSGYSFYMVNWYDIWVRTGIKDWMRDCSIWPKR
jgi:hypothetical protein